MPGQPPEHDEPGRPAGADSDEVGFDLTDAPSVTLGTGEIMMAFDRHGDAGGGKGSIHTTQPGAAPPGGSDEKSDSDIRLDAVQEGTDSKGSAGALADEAFRNRLKWVTIVRILVISVMMAATVVLQGSPGTGEIFEPTVLGTIYTLAIGMYLASVAYILVLMRTRRRRALLNLTWVQLAGDLVFSWSIVWLTGGTGSVFSFFFSLAVVTAALVLYRRGALAMATGSFGAFLILGALELSRGLRQALEPFLGWLLPFDHLVGAGGPATGYNIAVNGIAFYAIAFLSSYLSEQLRAADQRIRAQATTLENLEDLLNGIVSSIPIGLITTDHEGRIIFMNPEAIATSRIDPDQVLGMPVAKIFGDLRHILANRDKHGRVVNEITSQLIGREIRLLRWTITPLKAGARGDEGELLVFEDITATVNLEKAMQENRNLASIGKLAAGIAHEIRNPLGAISGCVQMLRQGMGGDQARPDTVRLMDIILRETQHLNRWINDFLAYARPRKPEFEPVDLARLSRDVVFLAEKDKDLHKGLIHVRYKGPDSLLASADAGQLRQVLWNLVQNAMQALQDQNDGMVVIELVPPVEGSDVQEVAMLVRDNGPGIPPEDQSAIFEPFFTTREHGTGLGLATVHRIVQNHHGHIDLRSAPETGTVFTVYLPAEKRRRRAGAAA